MQSHLPLLTVSASPRLPLPIIPAAIFPPVSALSICIIERAVGIQPLTVLYIYILEAVFQSVCTHMGNIFTLHPAPVLSLTQLLGARESAKGPLDVNYRIVFHICQLKRVFFTWKIPPDKP